MHSIQQCCVAVDTLLASADSRYQRLSQASVPLNLHKCIKLGEPASPLAASGHTSVEQLLITLFKSSENRFRHDEALAGKLQDKVLLLHKAKKVRSVSAAVAVRESKSRKRYVRCRRQYCSIQLIMHSMKELSHNDWRTVDFEYTRELLLNINLQQLFGSITVAHRHSASGHILLITFEHKRAGICWLRMNVGRA